MSSEDPANINLKAGPVKERQCRDICFAFLFLIFIFAMVLAGFFGYNKGDPTLLLHPFDSAGNQCGLSKYNTTDYKYL